MMMMQVTWEAIRLGINTAPTFHLELSNKQLSMNPLLMPCMYLPRTRNHGKRIDGYHPVWLCTADTRMCLTALWKTPVRSADCFVCSPFTASTAWNDNNRVKLRSSKEMEIDTHLLKPTLCFCLSLLLPRRVCSAKRSRTVSTGTESLSANR